MNNKKIICVVTGTRAEYHLLYPLLERIRDDGMLELKLVVTGAHLSSNYGNTVKDIESDGFLVDKKISILKNGDSVKDINSAMAAAITGFGKYFANNRPDMLVLLGDRYELLSVAIAALNYSIPISHLHGGETTEGAIDEYIRHSISKMSYLHFTSCETYRKRVIQLGEDPDRVFNVGAIGIENIKRQKLLTKQELEESIGFKFDSPFALITFHPVTLEPDMAGAQIDELLQALDYCSELKLLFTKANADSGGLIINKRIDEYVARNPERSIAVFSLGMVRYLTAMSMANMVIGNSSSGIIESPSFHVPVVNIGDRQKGRIQANNIINCTTDCIAISNAIKKCLDMDFVKEIRNTVNPYGDGNVSLKIVERIKDFLYTKEINLKKSFYDIDF